MTGALRSSPIAPSPGGDLFRRLGSRPLPDWAAEIDCRSWAQVFLKWIVSDPFITCAIPATRHPRYLEDNMAAGSGRLPDPAMRRMMVEVVARL